MASLFSSAGLLYVYCNGYEENGMLFLEQIDTYHYIEEQLYYKIMGNVALASEDNNIVHIFAVIGPKEKTNLAYSIIENEMITNFQNILSNKSIKTYTKQLDSVGNTFFRCVQEFYCTQPDHFPKRIYHDYGDIILGGIFCHHASNKKGDAVAEEIISLWLERENPMLCGRQLMTRSFFLNDFVDRKVVAMLPDVETGVWRQIFEGGHQLYLSEDVPYMKETLHPNALGSFCSSNLQSILLNPIYAYGKWFQTTDICEEWHKVFLYLCAVSDIDWNQSNIAKLYEKFLSFLEENVCLTLEAESFFPEEQYCAVLLRHIVNFRSFLQGDDEPVISKDLHQTMNSRYVYLPYLWPLFNLPAAQNCFSSAELQELINRAIGEEDRYKKGLFWEDTAEYVLKNIQGWKITGRRIKVVAQEIDLSIANISLDNDLWQLGAYILVECKNWNKHVDIHQIRNIAHISNMKGNKTAILFATNGVTLDAQQEIYRLVASNLSIICLTASDLTKLHSAEDCKALILERWQVLQEQNELSILI